MPVIILSSGSFTFMGFMLLGHKVINPKMLAAILITCALVGLGTYSMALAIWEREASEGADDGSVYYTMVEDGQDTGSSGGGGRSSRLGSRSRASSSSSVLRKSSLLLPAYGRRM